MDIEGGRTQALFITLTHTNALYTTLYGRSYYYKKRMTLQLMPEEMVILQHELLDAG